MLLLLRVEVRWPRTRRAGRQAPAGMRGAPRRASRKRRGWGNRRAGRCGRRSCRTRDHHQVADREAVAFEPLLVAETVGQLLQPQPREMRRSVGLARLGPFLVGEDDVEQRAKLDERLDAADRRIGPLDRAKPAPADRAAAAPRSSRRYIGGSRRSRRSGRSRRGSTVPG